MSATPFPVIFENTYFEILQSLPQKNPLFDALVMSYAALGTVCRNEKSEIAALIRSSVAKYQTQKMMDTKPTSRLIHMLYDMLIPENKDGQIVHSFLKVVNKIRLLQDETSWNKIVGHDPFGSSDDDSDDFGIRPESPKRSTPPDLSEDSDSDDVEGEDDTDIIGEFDTGAYEPYVGLIRCFVAEASAYHTESRVYHKELGKLFSFVGQIPNNYDAAHTPFAVYLEILHKIQIAFKEATTVADKTAFIKMMTVYLSHKPVRNPRQSRIYTLHTSMCLKIESKIDVVKTKTSIAFHRAVLNFLSRSRTAYRTLSSFSLEMMKPHIEKMMDHAMESGSAETMKNLCQYFPY